MSNRKYLPVFALCLLAAAALAGFQAWRLFSQPAITVEWSTASELNTAGYYLYRGLAEAGPFERITSQVIPAAGDPLTGGAYSYLDEDVRAGQVYYYQLIEVELDGNTQVQGVIPAEAARQGWLEAALAVVLLGCATFFFWESRPTVSPPAA